MIYPPMSSANSFSYSLTLPDSIGSIVRFEPIDQSVELQKGHEEAMVLKSYRDATPKLKNYNYGWVVLDINTYVVIKPITCSSSSHDGDGIHEYRAASIWTRFQKSARSTDSHTIVRDKLVTLKICDDNQESISKLKEQVARSAAVRGGGNCKKDRMLHVWSSFMDEQSGKHWAVILSSPHGSLRKIMKNRFPRGFPEDLIPIALRKILKPLRFLHSQDILHRDISAGHVYLFDPTDQSFSNMPRIALGFAGAVYEDDGEMGNTAAATAPYLPMASISSWGAAPEVYNGAQPYSQKADIWLVGITALELAYGGLKIANRNTLEAMIKVIHDKKKLPSKTWVNPEIIINEEIIEKAAADMTRTPEESTWGYYWNLLGMSSSSSSYDDDTPFSQAFTNMVMECLAWDPKKRPTVDKLISHKFFTKGYLKPKGGGKYFYNVVMKKTPMKSF